MCTSFKKEKKIEINIKGGENMTRKINLTFPSAFKIS